LINWIEDDAENPLELSEPYKWAVTVFVSVATLAVALSSSAYAGTTTAVGRDFGGSKIVLTLPVSLFVLGFAIGPVVFAPLSEVLGRRSLYIVSYGALTLWTGVTLASPNLATFIVLRFLAGAFGASPLTNAGGSIADMFDAQQRGLALAVFAAAPFLGPSLGPLTAGFLTVGTGRWQPTFEFLTAFCGVLFLIGIVAFPETYAPVLLRKRAQKLTKLTGKHYISRMDQGKDVRLTSQFKVALSRPWLLLAFEPIVLSLALYIAIIYGVLYSFFSAFPIVFGQIRGWNAGAVGLSFLGVLVGMLAGLVFVVWYYNPRYIKVAAASPGGVAPPEARLPPAMLGGVAIVVGLAIFAGTTGPQIHWFMPIAFGGAPFGFGMVLLFLSVQNYLVDAYLIFAASVLAANAVIRALFGAAFPLFTPYMYNPSASCPAATCGIHVGPAIATALALLCVPIPFVLSRYGPQIRARGKFGSEAAKVLELMRAKAGAHEGQEEKKHSPAQSIHSVDADETAANSLHHTSSGSSHHDHIDVERQ